MIPSYSARPGGIRSYGMEGSQLNLNLRCGFIHKKTSFTESELIFNRKSEVLRKLFNEFL